MVKVQLLVWAGLVPCRGMPAVLYFLAGNLLPHGYSVTRRTAHIHTNTYTWGGLMEGIARTAMADIQEDLSRTYK